MLTLYAAAVPDHLLRRCDNSLLRPSTGSENATETPLKSEVRKNKSDAQKR
jgi:hypothetical protein